MTHSLSFFPASSSSVDPSVLLRYQTGFNECAQEVNRYLLSVDGLQPEVRLRLMNHLAECITAPQPSHPAAADRTTVRITPPQFNDMRCVIDRLPVTCSNVIHPLTSQMQLSPVAMEQMRFRDAIGRVTSPYDVISLPDSSVTANVSGVMAHAHHRRADWGEEVAGLGEMLKSWNRRRSEVDEEISLEDAQVLIPPLHDVRGKWRPLVERNNNNSQNISLNATNIRSNICSPHPLNDDDDEQKAHVLRTNFLPVLCNQTSDVKEEPVWRPW